MLHISSRENPQIKLAVRLRESASARREHGLFFLEGWRLCVDALESGYVPEMLFTTTAAQQKYPIKYENVTLISEPVAQKLADTVNSQGIFGVFQVKEQPVGFSRKAQRMLTRPKGDAPPQVVALENLQDPANLGAIARTAEALGLSGLVVSGGCDVFHPKALRASMGALLRLQVTQVDDLPAFLRESKLPSFAAVPDSQALLLPDCDFSSGAVVAIGNEGSGLSKETIAACGQRLSIPMRGKSESLNAAAAAAIIMWEMQLGVRDQESGVRG